MQSISHGLIGHPLGHSLSPFIHESLLASAGLSGTYRLFDIPPDELSTRAPQLLDELDGFNVTIPHKEAVIPLLDGLDRSAADFGAVNTVFRRRGFNTDRIGFRREGLDLTGRRVLVLGAGGVSRMLAFESLQAGAQVFVASRTLDKAQRLADELGATALTLADLSTDAQASGPAGYFPVDVILNGSPVGMWPHNHEIPVPDDLVHRCRSVYDTIYNPPATRMLLLARSIQPDEPVRPEPIRAGNGLGMLFEQALEAERIWHPEAVFPESAQQEIRHQLPARLLHDFPMHIVLTGFMGSGKSTAGQSLASQLGLAFVDLDEEMVRIVGMSIPDIFADEGEPWFRSFERRTLQQVVDRPESLVLSVGGGALVEPESVALIRKRPSQVVFLHVPLPELTRRLADGEGRPMLAGDVQERTRVLYNHRLPRYQASADLTVDGSGDPVTVAKDIARKLGYNTGGHTQ